MFLASDPSRSWFFSTLRGHVLRKEPPSRVAPIVTVAPNRGRPPVPNRSSRPIPTILARKSIVAAAALAACWIAAAAPARAQDAGFRDGLKAHVDRLASPEFAGRGRDTIDKAARYVADRFREMKDLEPLFGESPLQPIVKEGTEAVIGLNIGFALRSDHPVGRDEWVILSAHYDHLGRAGRAEGEAGEPDAPAPYFPGANDNASGVAMLLESARAMARAGVRPRRNVAFVAFDLEEVGLWGSRYFVDHPPMRLESVKLFMTADIIAGSLGGIPNPFVFAIGTERLPETRAWIADAARGSALEPMMIGSDIVGTRSDYGPFRARKVPFLFFSTGESPTYHTTRDTADSIELDKLERISRLILAVTRAAADAESIGDWRDAPDNGLDEARAIRDVLAWTLERREVLKMNALQTRVAEGVLDTLNKALDRGSLSPSERSAMVRVAQLLMTTVF